MRNNDFNYSYHYANWHCNTDESKKKDIESAKLIFDGHNIYPVNKEDKILEIGCGMGRLMLMLQNAGYKNITGVDIDEAQIKIAKKERLNAFLRDINDFLSETKEIYDAIYCFDVLEHIDKEKQLPLLRLIKRHLSERGFVVFQIPNALSPTMGYYRYCDFTHNISYTDISIDFLLRNAGIHFYIVRPQLQESRSIQKMKLPWARLYKYEYCISNFILTPNLIVVAFKHKKLLDKYLENAPVICNNYKENILWQLWMDIKVQINKFLGRHKSL